MSFALLLGPGFVPATAPIAPVDHTLFGLPPMLVVGGGIVAFLIVAGLIGNTLRSAGSKIVAKRRDDELTASGVPAAELRRRAMEDPVWFLPVQALLRGEPVLGLAEVGFPRSASNDTIVSIFNSLGPLLGVRLIDKDLGSYVVLTPTALHYVLFDAGQLQEHKVWPRAELTECILREEYDTSERRIDTVEYSHALRLGHAGASFELPVSSTITRSPQRRALLGNPSAESTTRLHALTRGFFAELDSRVGAP